MHIRRFCARPTSPSCPTRPAPAPIPTTLTDPRCCARARRSSTVTPVKVTAVGHSQRIKAQREPSRGSWLASRVMASGVQTGKTRVSTPRSSTTSHGSINMPGLHRRSFQAKLRNKPHRLTPRLPFRMLKFSCGKQVMSVKKVPTTPGPSPTPTESTLCFRLLRATMCLSFARLRMTSPIWSQSGTTTSP